MSRPVNGPALSSDDFRLLVGSIGDYAIFMLDPQGRVATWNLGAERIKGYRADEIIGQHFSRFYPREDIANDKPARELEIALERGSVEDEGWRIRKDGTRFWANVVITALRDETGTLRGFGKVTRDLSERRAAEERLRRSEEQVIREQAARAAAEAAEARVADISRRLEVILETMDDGITVQDRDGRIAFANTAGAIACGASSPAELLKVTAAQLVNRFEITDEEGRPIALDDRPARKALRGEGPNELTMRVRDRETNRVWWSHVRARPVGKSGEVPELVVNVFHDITQARRQEQAERYLSQASAALASSLDLEETLRTFAGLLVPGLGDWCSIDLWSDGKLRKVATAHVDPKKVQLAREYEDRYPPNLDDPGGIGGVLRNGSSVLYPVLTDELLERGARDAEHLALIKSLQLRSIIIAPIRIRDQVAGALTLVAAESGRTYDTKDVALAEELGRRAGTAIENARLYRAAQEAAVKTAEASRIKDEFLATVSHELRTPLNAIVGWASLLRERATDPMVTKAIEVIHRNAQAQVKIIEDILDVSRVITGKFRLDPRPVDLVAIVRDAIEVVRPSALAKQITIGLTSETSQAQLVADPERLQQVVWNLLSNAVKFTEAGGSIQIRIRLEQGQLVLKVTDTGKGIDAEFLPFVFDRFKQADSSTTRRFGGLGLGLALVRHIVELHGGQVHAASDGRGRGSTFTIALPVRAVALPAPPEEDTPPPESSVGARKNSALGGVRVLVVDDDEDARDLLSTVLMQAGGIVETAASAAEAFAAVQRFRPDVLVSDIGMPGEDGYSLISRVRQLPAEVGGALPALALTAYTRGEDRAKALAAGYTTHIGKPVDPEHLTSAVASLAVPER